MRKKKNIVLEDVLVENYAAEGKSLARTDGKVVFIEGAVPGDVVDVRLSKNKKDWAEGHAINFKSYSKERVQPFCQHFGVCGGCQWQMLSYEKQLQYKHQQVVDNLSRIGKVKLPEFQPIIGAIEDKYYRNKLEYTFSTKEFTKEKPAPSNSPNGGEPNAQSSLKQDVNNISGTQISVVSALDPSPVGGSRMGAVSLPLGEPAGLEFYEEADPMLYSLLKDFVSQHRSNPTLAEDILWEQLRGKKLENYKFRRQHIIGAYIADFVCLAKKLVIEVDGLIHQLPENKENDEKRTQWLNSKGYEVIRFRNEDILERSGDVLEKIKVRLNELSFAERKMYEHKDLVETSKSEVGAMGSPPLGELEGAGALGFHARGFFDKVVHIEKCWLQPEPTNEIRNAVRQFARARGYTFYDYRAHKGLLRNLVFRICTTGEVMVNVVFGEDDQEKTEDVLNFIKDTFSQITTLVYTVNLKKNDSIFDLEPVAFTGKGYVIENLEDFQFRIGPKSFFQTNTRQGERLYQVTREFAELDGSQTLYDLYCGTGSIGIFCSKGAKKVIGVEAVGEAVSDAKGNALLNNIQHAEFFCGDVIDVCNDDFFKKHGFPDVIITDPPRAGMHAKLVEKILEIEAPLVVYVSCNPATQARDLSLLDMKYEVTKVQPVDMFPHTHHIENIVQLKRK